MFNLTLILDTFLPVNGFTKVHLHCCAPGRVAQGINYTPRDPVLATPSIQALWSSPHKNPNYDCALRVWAALPQPLP